MTVVTSDEGDDESTRIERRDRVARRRHTTTAGDRRHVDVRHAR